jgi:putative colanic acid biosynthesis UDP-glucose lipid carrier transferase
MLGSKNIIRPSHSMVDAVFRTVDAGCIFAALYLSTLVTTTLPVELFWLVGAMAAVLFNMIGAFCGMYRNWRGTAVDREIMCGQISWFFAFAALVVAGYATTLPDQISRATTLCWFVATALLIALNRIAIRVTQRALRTHGLNSRKYAIVGVTKIAFQLAENIDKSPDLGLMLHGFYDDRPQQRTPQPPSKMGRYVGNLDELVEAARNREVDLIYITFPMRAEDRIRGVLSRLADSTATVYIVPDFFVFELLHSRWTNIGGLPAVSIFEQPFYGVDGMVKRALDLTLATAALVLCALPMLAIALLIRATSPGPVFFRQRRYGLDGREIHVWKFRSMSVCEDGAQVTQARRNDARVTRIGAILRSTSLDEIPQLFNVLQGSMSLVGPRPHATAHNEHYRKMIEGYMLRHKVRPGITGLAQVNGCRGETDTLDKMQRRVEYDHRYIREWSVWLDLQILFQTMLIVWSRQNAY